MNRISYDGGPFHGELHKAIVGALNFEIRNLCKQIQIPRRQIYRSRGRRKLHHARHLL